MRRKEITISTDSNSGHTAQTRSHALALKSAAIASAASRQAAFARKKSRKSNRFSAYVSYLAIISLILSIVSVGYQSPVQGDAAGGTVSRAAIAANNPSVDQVAAVQMAVVAADTADIAVASNVENLSVSLSAKSELAQADESLLSKPQIVQPSGSSRDIQQYTVVSGDTVASIATAHGVSPETVRWANGLTSDAAPIGKVLSIPSVSGIMYTIKPGDTADSLAQRYDADKNRIVTYNDAEISGLQPGQRIVIPGGVLPQEEQPGYHAPRRGSSNSASGSLVVAPRITIVAGNRYAYGYCTYYVYSRRAELGMPVGSFWGNANTWASFARASGYLVNNTPTPGAVLQTASGGGGYGHVAVVENVGADGSITVSEMNYVGWNIVSTRTIPAGQASLYNYIH